MDRKEDFVYSSTSWNISSFIKIICMMKIHFENKKNWNKTYPQISDETRKEKKSGKLMQQTRMMRESDE